MFASVRLLLFNGHFTAPNQYNNVAALVPYATRGSVRGFTGRHASGRRCRWSSMLNNFGGARTCTLCKLTNRWWSVVHSVSLCVRFLGFKEWAGMIRQWHQTYCCECKLSSNTNPISLAGLVRGVWHFGWGVFPTARISILEVVWLLLKKKKMGEKITRTINENTQKKKASAAPLPY